MKEFKHTDLMGMVNELERVIEDCEPLETTPTTDATKLIFNRLFDYDEPFRYVITRAVLLTCGILVTGRDDMARKLCRILDAGNREIQVTVKDKNKEEDNG
jgi:hypothetical protein